MQRWPRDQPRLVEMEPLPARRLSCRSSRSRTEAKPSAGSAEAMTRLLSKSNGAAT